MLKSQNLPKFRFKNLFKSKKVQNTSSMKEFNFLTFNIRVAFTKLGQAFIQVSIF